MITQELERMPTIRKTDDKPLQDNANMNLPARFVPSFRVVQAAERGVVNNILFRMHGGLGDIICAEPAVRYALKHFKGQKFSLATLYPGLFQHLTFDKVYDLTEATDGAVKSSSFLIYENTDTSNELAAEFICHPLMHGIDYASMYMWRMILPKEDREMLLVPSQQELDLAAALIDIANDIIIHPGKTWQSRTMPKKFWDKIIAGVVKAGKRPVIIGGSVDNGRASTIDVDATGALDVRNKLSIMETVAVLQRAKVLLTNDSSPLHMATTGEAWIGFFSTVKHPDHLLTYRHNVWAWRMQNLALGGVYETLDACPNKQHSVSVSEVDVLDLLRWLPQPEEVVAWALEKLETP